MEPSKAYLSFPKTKTPMTADLALVGIIQGGEKKKPRFTWFHFYKANSSNIKYKDQGKNFWTS